MRRLKKAAFSAGFALIFYLPLAAAAQLQFAVVQGELTGVPPPEIPVRAANVVLHAGKDDKAAATTNVILAVVEMNPCTVPSTVAQIARTSPAMAALAAATAVSLQPNQVFLITKAGVGAAPGHITAVVSAIVDQNPGQYVGVADAAAEVYPAEGTNILNGVVRSIPVLGSFVDELVAKNSPGENLPVAAILNQGTLMALHRTAVPVAKAAPASPPAAALDTASPTPEGEKSPGTISAGNK